MRGMVVWSVVLLGATGCVPSLIVGGALAAGQVGAAASENRGPDLSEQHDDEASCRNGEIQSCVRAARRCERGTDGVPLHLPRAASLYDRACELRHASSCDRLAALYTSKPVIVPDGDGRREALMRPCVGVKGPANCERMAAVARQSPADAAVAAELDHIGCERGSQRSCAAAAP